MPSRQALELLQVRQIRSPGQELRNSSRHLRHFRSSGSYVRSGSGLEFFSELLMARIYSSSLSELRYFFCAAHKHLFRRPRRNSIGSIAVGRAPGPGFFPINVSNQEFDPRDDPLRPSFGRAPLAGLV